MKLDILKKQWLDIVFEGRNKTYGAYELRRENPKTTVTALLIGGIAFSLLMSAPLLANLLPNGSIVAKPELPPIVLVNLNPKIELPKEVPAVERSAPRVEVKKFVKLVVATTIEVVENPPKISNLKNAKFGSSEVDGDPNAALTIAPVGNGPTDVVEGGDDPTKIFNEAGIQIKADFPGGVNAFRAFIAKNFVVPTDYGFKTGTVYVSFVVETDGSISNITIVRDPGYGTGKEAERVIKSNNVKWIPGIQNGRKVRMLFNLPIKVQALND